jgi:hypothetical protein
MISFPILPIFCLILPDVQNLHIGLLFRVSLSERSRDAEIGIRPAYD